jgi:hypothetical protein
MMKRFFALCVILGLAVPFAGCDKKAETKPAAPAADAAAPAGDAAPAGGEEKK